MAEEERSTQPKNGDELRGKSQRGRQKTSSWPKRSSRSCHAWPGEEGGGLKLSSVGDGGGGGSLVGVGEVEIKPL